MGQVKTPKAWEKIGAAVLGVVFLITIIIMAVKFPTPSKFQYIVFRIVLAIACAGVAAIIPGFLDLHSKMPGVAIRAGGAIAIFIIVYFYSPAKLFIAPQAITITGMVTDKSRNPIENATITVDAFPFKAESRFRGMFAGKLDGANVGDVITIRAYHNAYKSFSCDILIKSINENCEVILDK